MASGGKREGAGRKRIENRPTADHVRAASETVDKLQPRAVKALEEGLSATTEEGFPDHATRIRAAGMLMNKRIPDVARQEVTGKDGEKLDLGITYYPQKKPIGA